MKEKDFLKLNLFGAQTYTARADEANENEDFSISESIVTGIYENTWLTPGVTFNDSYTMNKGTMYVPVLGQFLADTSALCDESEAEGYEGTTNVAVSIDTKTSTWINGCYASKGIVNQSLHNKLKDEAGKAIGEEWQNQVEAMISSEGQAWTYTATDLEEKPRSVLNQARIDYKKENKVVSTTAIINYDMEFLLIESLANGAGFTPAKNEEALVNGTLGTLYGMLLIPADIAEAFYLYNWQVLHVPIAKNAISDHISGDNGNFNQDVPGFDNGMLQLIDTVNAKSGVGQTWIHLNYGKKVVSPRQFYVATEEVVAP